MKNYFLRALVAAVAFTVVYLLFDLIFGNSHTVREYVTEAVFFGLLFGLFKFADDKVAWEKVRNWFKRR